MQYRVFLGAFYSSLFTAFLILLGLVFSYRFQNISHYLFWATILYGCVRIFLEVVNQIRDKHFNPDYIAIAAITFSIYTNNALAGSIIILMLETGRGLEKYSRFRAEFDLNKLINHIPDVCEVITTKGKNVLKQINQIKVNEVLVIKKGEIIPLDGILLDSIAFINESSLTGEVLSKPIKQNSRIYSGTINEGELIKIKVTRTIEHSTYTKLIEIIKQAKQEKSKLLKITNKYNINFTILTTFICLATYFTFYDLERVLTVLVLATPCPLILATPVALISGINQAAKNKIIFKNLYALEDLSKVDTLIFDKTGTLTESKLKVTEIKSNVNYITTNEILQIAYSIEQYSMHPIARAICSFAVKNSLKTLGTTDIKEVIGKNISGKIKDQKYTISGEASKKDLIIDVLHKQKLIGKIYLNDTLKSGVAKFFDDLFNLKYTLVVLSGDIKNHSKILKDILSPKKVLLKFNLKPEQKLDEIKNLKKQGKTIAMIGDGINDAPALAAAHVGIAFNTLENNITKEVADVILFDQDIESVRKALSISKNSLKIAKQSIFGGMTLSIFFMLFASFGYFTPINGALIQELIDVLAILNALRANKESL